MPNYRVLLVVGASGKQKTARKRERAVEKVRVTAVQRGGPRFTPQCLAALTPLPNADPHLHRADARARGLGKHRSGLFI